MAILLFLRILLLLPTKPKPFIPTDQSNRCGFQVRINNIRDSHSPLQLSALCLPRGSEPLLSHRLGLRPQLLLGPQLLAARGVRSSLCPSARLLLRVCSSRLHPSG